MTVVLIISLSLLFIIVILVVYKTYIRGRQEETETSDLLTNLLPFIKSADEGKEYSLI